MHMYICVYIYIFICIKFACSHTLYDYIICMMHNTLCVICIIIKGKVRSEVCKTNYFVNMFHFRHLSQMATLIQKWWRGYLRRKNLRETVEVEKDFQKFCLVVIRRIHINNSFTHHEVKMPKLDPLYAQTHS